MKEFMTVIVVLFLIIVGGIMIHGCTTNNDREKIHAFVDPERTVEIDRRTWRTGPYWVTKNCRIYYVRTTDNRELWFRFDLFGFDVEEKINDDYVTCK